MSIAVQLCRRRSNPEPVSTASDDKVAAGYQAQLDSIVMLKNEDRTIKKLPLAAWKSKTVYIPSSMATSFAGPWSGAETTSGPTLSVEVAQRYFKKVLTDTPEGRRRQRGRLPGARPQRCHLVLAGMRSPDNSTNFSKAGMNPDGTFYPLSLHYRPYTADGANVRRTSIAGDLLADGTQQNRSYYGATSKIGNEYDLDTVLNAVKAVEKTGKKIPVVVAMKAKNPVVPSEFEGKVDALLVGFSVSDPALIETALGQHDPQGRLPIAFPKDMDAIEAQQEDVGEDVTPYVDEQGNTYRFGFRLSWKGVIS